MGKYSEVLSYEEILGFVKDRYNSVLIVGCGSCMNESLALKNNDLVFYKENHYPPVENECIRLSTLLCDHGIKASYHIIKSGSDMGCIRSAEGESKGIGEINNAEAILMMSCFDGVWGIGDYLRGRGYHIPVYWICRWKGFYYLRYKEDEEKKSKVIVDGTVRHFC